MGGDDGDRTDAAEVVGDGDGQGGAFFGVGGGAEFVEQHERVRGRNAGNEVDVGNVGGEGGKILLDGLVVADVGENCVKNRELGTIGGGGEAALGPEGEESDGLQGDGLAAGVGTGDDELAAGTFEFDRDGNNTGVLRLEAAFQ